MPSRFRTTIIILVILIIVVIVGLVYVFFFRGAPSDEVAENNETEESVVFPLDDPTAIKAVLEQVARPLHLLGQIRYFDLEQSKLFLSVLDGEDKEELASLNFINFYDLVWAPSGEKAVFIFKDKNGDMAKYGFDRGSLQVPAYVYDSKTYPLDSQIGGITFSKDSRQIFFQHSGVSGQENVLAKADIEGQNEQNVLPFGADPAKVYWTGLNKIVYSAYPTALEENIVYMANPDGSEQTEIVDPYPGQYFNWTKSGQRGLLSRSEEEGNKVSNWIWQSDWLEPQKIGLGLIIDKCAWASDEIHIFCAIPRDIPAGTILPDDYLSGDLGTNDDLAVINVNTGKYIEISWPEGDAYEQIDVSDIFYVSEKKYLFFRDRNTETLYRADLTGITEVEGY